MKKLLIVALVILCVGTVQAADNSATYYVPPNQFNAAMEVMDNGFANIFALFRVATAGFAFDDTNKSISNLRVAVDTTSLLATNDIRQRDLANMLVSFQNPEIRITAPDSVSFVDNKAEIKTTVSFHGVSKPVTFTASLNHVGKSPHGGGMWGSEGTAVGLSMQGVLKRSDFGMTDNPETPARFGDTITLRLEMEAVGQ